LRAEGKTIEKEQDCIVAEQTNEIVKTNRGVSTVSNKMILLKNTFNELLKTSASSITTTEGFTQFFVKQIFHRFNLNST